MLALTPDRALSDLKVNTPRRTLTTEAESYFRSMYSNVSNEQNSTPRLPNEHNSSTNN